LSLLAIVMSPTRELALQTTKECKKFAKLFNIRCVAVYGGTGISEQIVSLVFSNEKCLFNDVF
jgi:ATP-dependent RNA helicase DDX46/PRP5